MPDNKITPRVAAIFNTDHSDGICGTGILLNSRYVLTCAHVVCDAHGIYDPHEQQAFVGFGRVVPLSLFRFSGCETKLNALVELWYPPRVDGDRHGLADIALLRLCSPLPYSIAPMHCLEESQLHSGEELLAAGLSSDEGEWVRAQYMDRTTNWHQIPALHDDKFLGGLSGGPVVRRFTNPEVDKLVGMTVANSGSPRKGQMIGLSILKSIPQIAEAIEPKKSTAPLVAKKPELDIKTLPVEEIKERCLCFFNRQGLVDSVNQALQETSYVVIAVKGQQEDDFQRLASRLLYEAPDEQIHESNLLWELELPELHSAALLENSMLVAAKAHFFAGETPSRDKNKPVENWQHVVMAFAEQFLKKAHSRFVIQINLPKAYLSKKEKHNISNTLSQWDELQQALSAQCVVDILIVFFLESGDVKQGMFGLSKFSYGKQFDFDQLCQNLGQDMAQNSISFISEKLKLIKKQDIEDWGHRCFEKRFKVENKSFYSELCQEVERHVEKKREISYAKLVQFVCKRKSYQQLFVTKPSS